MRSIGIRAFLVIALLAVPFPDTRGPAAQETGSVVTADSVPVSPEPLPLPRLTGGRIYLMGWSSDGRLGWVWDEDRPGGGTRLTVIVQDMVTDDILYRSDPVLLKSPGRWTELRQSYAGYFRDVSSFYGLDDHPVRPESSGFSHDGRSYEARLIRENGVTKLRLERGSRDYKDVWEGVAGRGGDEPEILGVILSGREPRAAVICRTGPGEPLVVGAHLTVGFRSRETPETRLADAVMNGQEYIVRQLLAEGVSPDVRNGRSVPVLVLSVRLGHQGIFRDLLAAGADPDAPDSRGRGALHTAAADGDAGTVKVLLDAGASPDLPDNDGRTPLDLAREAGATPVVSLLE